MSQARDDLAFGYRGGSWGSNTYFARTRYRSIGSASLPYRSIGFRLLRRGP